jgi:hypothetical protein
MVTPDQQHVERLQACIDRVAILKRMLQEAVEELREERDLAMLVKVQK